MSLVKNSDSRKSVGIGERPILEGDDYTPAVLAEFEDLAQTYVEESSDVEEESAVRYVARGITGRVFRDWFALNRTTYEAMSLSQFMDHVREYFLPSTWQRDLRKIVFGAEQGTRTFHEWALEARRANAVLPAAQRLSHDILRELLQARLEPKLAKALQRHPVTLPRDRTVPDDAEVVDEETGKHSILHRTKTIDHSLQRFTEWLAHLKVLDEQLREDEADLAATIEAKVRARVKTASTASRTAAPPTTSRSPDLAPRLTDAEMALLRQHRGCFRCRRFYAGHGSKTCRNGQVRARDHKTLTEEMALEAKAQMEKRKATTASPSTAPPSTAAPPSRIEEASDGETDPFEYVSPSVPHLLPQLLAVPMRPGDLYLPCEPLIDTGCPTVMIRPDLADALELKRHTMRQPEKMRGFAGKAAVELKEWVVFRLMSPDHTWKSRAVYAKVAPGMAYQLILGLPFLKRERITIDSRKRTAVAKRTSKDLMLFHFEDEPVPAPVPVTPAPIPSPAPSPAPPTTALRKRSKRQRLKMAVPTPKSSVWKVIHSHGKEMPSLSPTALAAVAGMVSRRLREQQALPHIISAAVQNRIAELQAEAHLQELHSAMMEKYKDRFPVDIPEPSRLPDTEYHRIQLKNADQTIRTRTYSCPQQYRDSWRLLIEQHLKAGRIRESSSPYASPSFVIPKADPKALPRWVCDFRGINSNTVKDRTPLPRIDEILNDCAKGRYFAKIDMTNAFFQTRMHPKDIHLTAVTTPFGLFEWTVMPMGLCNSPATHQRRMYRALRHLIGKICHVYLDDIIIWSQTIAEHKRNIAKVMEALQEAHLFCSSTKTQFFLTEVHFLGHIVSHNGIRADPAKVAAVKNWPRPRTTTQVRKFLGLVRYIAAFMPHLAEHSAALTPLTKKEYDRAFPEWTTAHQTAFDAIKELATGDECLATIQHDETGSIFVTTDASDVGTGAMLSVGETWQTARPVAYDSRQLNAAEQNYPTHEKELLAITRALEKWRYHLLGRKFTVYTDHRTLEYFHTQKDLSRRQARWAEMMADYDFEIKYVKGEENSVADALSRLPEDAIEESTAAPAMEITLEESLLEKIKEGYESDEFCVKLRANLPSMAGNGAREENGLLYRADRLIIPDVPEVRESLFRLAHDALGHFSTEKTYDALRDSYYWPGMKSQLEKTYIPGCDACQRNKSSTTKPPGPLHPLPVPNARFDSVAIDRVGPLPEEDGFNGILTMTDRLGAADIRLVPCRMDMSAEDCAELFFAHWYCENGLPREIVSDRDTLFLSDFWQSLHRLTGTKLKMSSAFHPQTDGASERTNKTLNQLLRYVVDRQQHGWVQALPRIRFAMMNTVNSSTGYTPFYLRMGHTPRLIPPLVPTNPLPRGEGPELAQEAKDCLQRLTVGIKDAQDALFEHKTRQAHYANLHRGPEDAYAVGDKVMLSTANRRAEYKARGENRTAKLMPRSDGPFEIIRAYPERSIYTLRLPGNSRVYPGFHASQLKRYIPNNDQQYPSRALERPDAVQGQGDDAEWELERILDRRRAGRGWQYRIQFRGWGAEDEQWRSRRELSMLAPEMLAEYEQSHPLP